MERNNLTGWNYVSLALSVLNFALAIGLLVFCFENRRETKQMQTELTKCIQRIESNIKETTSSFGEVKKTIDSNKARAEQQFNNITSEVRNVNNNLNRVKGDTETAKQALSQLQQISNNQSELISKTVEQLELQVKNNENIPESEPISPPQRHQTGSFDGLEAASMLGGNTMQAMEAQRQANIEALSKEIERRYGSGRSSRSRSRNRK